MQGRRDATTKFHVPLLSEALEILEQARFLSRNWYNPLWVIL